MKRKRISDDEIMRALINQVCKATPKNGTELDVVTFITKPMWAAFCRAVGLPRNAKPGLWTGIASVRVFGSHTIVIPGKALASVSLGCTFRKAP